MMEWWMWPILFIGMLFLSAALVTLVRLGRSEKDSIEPHIAGLALYSFVALWLLSWLVPKLFN